MTAKSKPPKKNTKSHLVGIRMPLPLLKRVDAFASNLQQQSPGLRISRADAIRVMIENWLAKVDAETNLGKEKRKGKD